MINISFDHKCYFKFSKGQFLANFFLIITWQVFYGVERYRSRYRYMPFIFEEKTKSTIAS